MTVLFAPTIAEASQLNIPPEATEAIRLMYSGHPDQAILLAHKLEADRPEHPLGYLVEANAIWWKIYCVSPNGSTTRLMFGAVHER
jgi:hypothetical protein